MKKNNKEDSELIKFETFEFIRYQSGEYLKNRKMEIKVSGILFFSVILIFFVSSKLFNI